MVRGLLIVGVVIVGLVRVADAQPLADEPEIAVYGGIDMGEARAVVRAGARQAGLAPGREPRMRVNVAEVAGEVMASIVIIDERGKAHRHVVTAATVAALEPGLADAMASSVRRPERIRRTEWVLVGVASGLALGAAGATWHAHRLRDDFFAEHVDVNGDVVGISPADARRAEDRARMWSATGIALAVAAGASGVAATVLFARDSDGETRPAGIAVAGRF